MMNDLPTLTPAQQIALWADKLRDLSAFGLYFAANQYDKERYETIQDIAMEMFALASDESLETLEPLRATVISHPTPFVAGDAAVIDAAGRILLIQRADNAKWALPGGALEVGETAAEGVVREVFEETGVSCQPVALVGVFDSRLIGFSSPHHIQVLTFLCRPLGSGRQLDTAKPVAASHAHEVLDVGWFAEDALPSDTHPASLLQIPEAYRVWRDGTGAFFHNHPASIL
jgi:ADP-ribose pyrophosphatase YjhB (NUDIX family)